MPAGWRLAALAGAVAAAAGGVCVVMRGALSDLLAAFFFCDRLARREMQRGQRGDA